MKKSLWTILCLLLALLFSLLLNACSSPDNPPIDSTSVPDIPTPSVPLGAPIILPAYELSPKALPEPLIVEDPAPSDPLDIRLAEFSTRVSDLANITMGSYAYIGEAFDEQPLYELLSQIRLLDMELDHYNEEVRSSYWSGTLEVERRQQIANRIESMKAELRQREETLITLFNLVD